MKGMEFRRMEWTNGQPLAATTQEEEKRAKLESPAATHLLPVSNPESPFRFKKYFYTGIVGPSSKQQQYKLNL